MAYRTPRNIIEFYISSVEDEKNNLDSYKQGDMEILTPGPVEKIFEYHFRLFYFGFALTSLVLGLILIDKFKNIQEKLDH